MSQSITQGVDILVKQFKKYGRKRFIEDSVKTYRSLFNQEYRDQLESIREIQKTLANKFGSTKDTEYRWGASIPDRLFNLIEEFLAKYDSSHPRFLVDKKELHWFMKKFSEFCVPEKI